MDLNFLMYLKILQGWDDIRTQDWMKKPFCDAIRAWIKLQQAWEELDIIALEAHQVAASIENEEAELAAKINFIKPTNPQLAQYINMAFCHQRNAHAHIQSKLVKLNTCTPYNGHLLRTQTPPNPPPSSSQNEPGSGTHCDILTPFPCITHSPPTDSPSQHTSADRNASAHSQPGQADPSLDETMEYSGDEQEEDTQEQSYQVIDKLVDVFADIVIGTRLHSDLVPHYPGQ